MVFWMLMEMEFNNDQLLALAEFHLLDKQETNCKLINAKTKTRNRSISVGIT